MNITLQRINCYNKSTLGLLYINSKFQAFTMEDQHRDIKVMGETRIPAGTYEVDYRNFVTPKTREYRSKYEWFKYHLEIKDVPGFKYVYLHVGNDSEDTEGCILLGDSAVNNGARKGFIGYSTQAFKRIYSIISDVLEINQKVIIYVKDEVLP